MPSAQTSLAALLLLLALVSEASAKGEKITFDRAVFSDGPSYRTNLCAIAQKVQAGEVQIKDALMGLNISVITPSDGPGDLHFSRNDNGTIADGSYPGMIARVLDELAERAGFRWRDSWAVVSEHPTPPRTWTEVLVWSVDTFDISALNWNNNHERMKAGVSFPNGYRDTSRILVTRRSIEAETMNFSGPYAPFSGELWLCILGAFFFSAIAYYIIERDSDEDLNFPDEPHNYAQSMFLTLVNFTGGGGGGYNPRTFAGRIFAVSFQWWCLLTIAAYTANLAAALIAQNGSKYGVTSLQDAITRQAPVCVFCSSADGDTIRRVHPTLVLECTGGSSESFAKLNEGTCSGVVTNVASWGLEQLDPLTNPGCANEYVGRSFLPVSNGFATKSDSAGMCTSLIRDTLDYFLTEMKTDGTIDEYLAEQYSFSGGQTCEATEAPTERRSSRGGRSDAQHAAEAFSPGWVSGPSRRAAEALSSGWLSSRRAGAGTKASTAATAVAATSAEGTSTVSSISITSMSSLFVVHMIATLVAIAIHFFGRRRARVMQGEDGKGESSQPPSVQQRLERLENRLERLDNRFQSFEDASNRSHQNTSGKLQALMTHLAVAPNLGEMSAGGMTIGHGYGASSLHGQSDGQTSHALTARQESQDDASISVAWP